MKEKGCTVYNVYFLEWFWKIKLLFTPFKSLLSHGSLVHTVKVLLLIYQNICDWKLFFLVYTALCKMLGIRYNIKLSAWFLKSLVWPGPGLIRPQNLSISEWTLYYYPSGLVRFFSNVRCMLMIHFFCSHYPKINQIL